MSKHGCSECGATLRIPPKKPMELVTREGRLMVALDWTGAFEHIRDQHPHLWTPEQAQEFEDWKAGKDVWSEPSHE